MAQKITIAYGNQIELTSSGKRKRKVFVKFSPAFREKQLKELKGAPLSVFLCYALHSDEYGYCWIDNQEVARETGYSNDQIVKAKNKLRALGYLYDARLYEDKTKRFRDWIYRIFQPVEPNKEFIVRGVKLKSRPPISTDVGKSPTWGKVGGIIEEEPYNNKEEPNKQSKALQASKDNINSLIALFKDVNPSYERLFGNTTERAAMKRLVKKFGREQVIKMIKGLKKIFGQPYAPTITTPYLLEKKLGNYIAYLQKKSQEKIDFIDFSKL